MGNAHQQMAQERCKKLLLKLSLSSSWQRIRRILSQRHQCCLGRSSQSLKPIECKAMKKITKPEERKGSFPDTTLEAIKPVAGVDTEAAMDDTSHTAGDSVSRPRVQATKLQATKDRNRRCDAWHSCFKLSKSNNKLSPYIRSKCCTALNREGYRHQFTSRAHKSLQTELGLVNTRSLGVTNSSRVLFSLSCSASSDNSPITDALPSRPAKLDINRGGNNAREAGNISYATQQRQLFFPIVCDSQEGRGVPPSSELEGFEQAHSRGAFQNGGLSYGEGSCRDQRLDGEVRLERCLLSSTSGPPEISSIPVAGSHLSVSLPSIWPVLCSLDIYKADEASSGLPKGERHQTNNLSG